MDCFRANFILLLILSFQTELSTGTWLWASVLLFTVLRAVLSFIGSASRAESCSKSSKELISVDVQRVAVGVGVGNGGAAIYVPRLQNGGVTAVLHPA